MKCPHCKNNSIPLYQLLYRGGKLNPFKCKNCGSYSSVKALNSIICSLIATIMFPVMLFYAFTHSSWLLAFISLAVIFILFAVSANIGRLKPHLKKY